jgi:hypothetical protein
MKCTSNCQTCSTSTSTCLTCLSSYYFFVNTNTCLTTCP